MSKNGLPRLRDAVGSDLDWLVALENRPENAAFVYQWALGEHAEHMRSPATRYLVMETNGEKAGYAILTGIDGDRPSVELQRIVVDRPGSGQGVPMLDAIVEFVFGELEADRLWLDVYDDNFRAQAAYRRVGFVETERRRDRNGRAMIVMGLEAKENRASD